MFRIRVFIEKIGGGGGLGFDGTFGQLLDQANCPIISSKWKLSDLRFFCPKSEYATIRCVQIIYSTYVLFVSFDQIRSNWAFGCLASFLVHN